MKKQLIIVIAVVVIIAILLVGTLVLYPMYYKPSTSSATTRTITDMYGRTVTVPTTINRVLTTGPIENELVYMLAPDKLAGLTFSLNGNPVLAETQYANLTIVGGTYASYHYNAETFLADNPDVIIDGADTTNTSLNTAQQEFSTVPVVGVYCGSDDLTGYAQEITFLCNLLGVQSQAQLLLNYYDEAMNYVQQINNETWQNRTTVYYAEGSAGLNTDPTGSMHTTLLSFCGGVNVANVALLPGYGMATVNPEDLPIWNPDIIIIGRGSEASLYSQIMNSSNPVWNSLTAVEAGRVYIRPDNPWSWFDGPPGPGQILGMYWMVHTLYPTQTANLNLANETTTFYTDFYHYNLTTTQVQTLLSGGNL